MFNWFFKKVGTKKKRVVSEDEQKLRERLGSKWLSVSGEDDPALEAVLNAAWNSSAPVMADWDDKSGLKFKKD
jgi:hypothetical protein